MYDSQVKEKFAISIILRQQHGLDSFFTGPLKINLDFYLKRANKKTHLEKFCHRKPDLDNLIKMYLDCLTGIAYEDDAQVCIIGANKCYTNELLKEITPLPGFPEFSQDQPHTVITIEGIK